jgi:hypothetical protein
MSCHGAKRENVKRSVSLVLLLAMWANCLCLVGRARELPVPPAGAAPRVAAGSTAAPPAAEGDTVPPAGPADAPPGENPHAGRVRVQEGYGKLPLRFEVNQGQTDPQVRFLARGGGYNLFLTPTESVLVLTKTSGAAGNRDKRAGAVVRTRLVGANERPDINGLDELSGKSNYFVGDDPGKWRAGVANYGRVRYEKVYPGIDLVYYGNQGRLEHDFVVAPGADPRAITQSFEGVRRLRVDRNGDLVLSVAGGELRQSKPVAYQEVEGQRREVTSRYRVSGRGRVSFEVGDYDRSLPLVIDPVLLYSTYLGGGLEDAGWGITVDAAGNAYVVGATTSTDFPVAAAFDSTNGGAGDVFITKLNPSGSAFVFSTYLGGSGADRANDVVLDSSGNVYLTGSTASSNFPVLGAFQSTYAGARSSGTLDAFVTKLNAAGSALIFSTYLGGASDDSGNGLALGPGGTVYVAGKTSSTNFPLLGAFQSVKGGAGDAFVTKLSAAGNALVYSTYLGGTGVGTNDFGDTGNAIAVDSAGSAYVVGETYSTNFPVAGAIQSSKRGSSDAFVTKLSPAGNALVYSTYLGGSYQDGFIPIFGDNAQGVAVDAGGNAYVTGSTYSHDFPTRNAYQGFNAGNFGTDDAFVSVLNAAGNGFIFSTYLGGQTYDGANDIALGSGGEIYITGNTQSPDFPTVDAVQTTNNGSNDAFVAKFNSTGSTLVYSTYLGGVGADIGNSIALDPANNAYVAGYTSSANFPTANAIRPASGGGQDAFVTKLSNLNGYGISGRVADDTGAGADGVTVTVTGSVTTSALTDAQGNYSFTNLPAGGNYTVTPSKAAFTFTPASQTFNALSSHQTADFTIRIYRITGRITDATGAATAGVTVSLTGTQTATTLTDSLGNYSFANLAVGNYTVTPSKTHDILTYGFTPPARTFTNLSSSQVADFTSATFLQSTLYPIADATVQDGASANSNFGTAATLGVRTDATANSGNNRDAYLRFDLSGVAGNVTSAKLRVYAALSAAGSDATSAYPVSSTNWVESGTGSIIWNNKPARGATAIAGATATVNTTTFAAYDIDVTAYIKGEKSAGRDLVSLALHNPTATTINTTLNSREAQTDKPQLLVSTAASNAAPAVSLTAPANGAAFNAPANITLSASATDSDGTVSRVEFYAGTSLVGTATASPYQINWPNIAAGTYSLSAVAIDNLGAATRSGTASITVSPSNGLPSVSLVSPAEGASLAAGSSVTVSANASDGDGTVSKVEFFAGATLIGTATTPSSGNLYSVTWSNVAPGAHALTAKATDNAGGSTTSAAVNVSAVSQTGLSPTADAYVRDGTSAAANFGTAADLQAQVSATAGNNRETHLKYDLTTVAGVTQTKLRLYGRLNDATASNVPFAVHSVAVTSWTETGVTWNTRPVAGASPLATATVADNVARWYEWDVTAYVKAEKAAGRNVVSFVVKGTGPAATFATFNSREAAANRPQLALRTTQARAAVMYTNSATLGAGDAAVRTRLQNLGYTVTVIAASKATAVTTAQADGKSLVVISSTVTPANVANKFRHVAVPVVTWEFDLLDDQGMTGTVSGTDFGTAATQTQLTITAGAHPMAAGLSGNVSVVSAASTFTWGKPNANAVKVAALISDATRASIFGYDGGAAMPGLEAPARRVALFMSDTTAGSFTAQGGSLFDAAIRWATETNTAPTITSLTPTSGLASTSVTVRGFNFGPAQGTSMLKFNGVAATPTSWGDGAVVAAVPQYATTGPVVITVGGVASNGVVFAVGATDTDGDGLADDWELQHFGNLSQGAGGDPDGDGLTNLQEYQQGRNPTKSALADSGDFVNLKVHTPLKP